MKHLNRWSFAAGASLASSAAMLLGTGRSTPDLPPPLTTTLSNGTAFVIAPTGWGYIVRADGTWQAVEYEDSKNLVQFNFRTGTTLYLTKGADGKLAGSTPLDDEIELRRLDSLAAGRKPLESKK